MHFEVQEHLILCRRYIIQTTCTVLRVEVIGRQSYYFRAAALTALSYVYFYEMILFHRMTVITFPIAVRARCHLVGIWLPSNMK